jgi:hypothetical protein
MIPIPMAGDSEIRSYAPLLATSDKQVL